MLQPIELKPGVVRSGTSYSAVGRWYDGNKIRFRDRYVEKIGGWTKYTTEAFAGICRALRRFAVLTGDIYTAIGTSTRFYVELGTVLDDVTPLRATSSGLTDPFNITDGSGTIIVTDSAHGASVGDAIIVSGASTSNGITAAQLNIETTILTVTDANTFTYLSNGTATSTDTTAGGTVEIKYILTPGAAGSTSGAGWGSSTWSRGTWGSAADLTAAAGAGQIAQWSVEPYGEDLIINPRYGSLYYWDASSPTARAVDFSTLGSANATPTKAIKTVVSTKNRHIICFGVNAEGSSTIDPMLTRWSDNESAVAWNATSTNTASSRRLTRGSRIITALPTREVILVWTDTSLYQMQWIGGQFVFQFDVVAERSQIAGFNAATGFGDEVYWMGNGGFYRYAGGVTTVPCDVQDYILNRVDWSYADKIYAGTNYAFDEVIWFYVSTDSTDGNPDEYVIYNTSNQAWYYGTMVRSAWKDAGFGIYPLAASTDGYLYYHEVGFDDGSTNPVTAITAYVESSPLELGNGDKYAFISRILHDVTFRERAAHASISQQMDITLKVSDYPGDSITDSEEETTERTATTPVEAYTTSSYVRLRGRQFKIRASSDTKGSSWRLGRPRLEIRTDGRR